MKPLLPMNHSTRCALLLAAWGGICVPSNFEYGASAADRPESEPVQPIEVREGLPK